MKLFSRRFKIQSFTYYIPAPPERKTGYREKQFDALFYKFINLGYEILSFQTVPHAGPEQSGMWLIAILRATNKQAEELNLEDVISNDQDLELEL